MKEVVLEHPLHTAHIDPIDPRDWDFLFQRLSDFMWNEGFQMVPTQHRLSITAACEDPTTMATMEYNGQKYPLPQTGQMQLEYELLKNPNAPGCWCYSTSYRQEKNPISGRHNLIFPMIEFETHGGIAELRKLICRLMEFLGFAAADSVPWLDYSEASVRYGASELTSVHEECILDDYGHAVLLGNFPITTHPFWNMKLSEDGLTAHKIDLILYGMETLGSAERSTDVEEMRYRFHHVSDGAYAETLFKEFGKARVLAELEDFLSLDFIPRFGGGIGMNRLIRAMRLHNLLPARKA